MPKINIIIAIILVISSLAIVFSALEINYFTTEAQVIRTSRQLANLTDQQHIWKPFSSTNVSQNNENLTISIITEYPEKLYNRAYLPTEVKSLENKPTFLNFNYVSKHILFSSNSNPIFVAEIRDQEKSQILWTSFLNDTSGILSNATFPLPSTILNKPIEFRLYIITQGVPAHSILSLKDAQIIEINNDSTSRYLNNKQMAAYPITVGNKTFQTDYDIYGAKLNAIKIDETNKRLDVDLLASSNGILIIELPRGLIDAKKQSDADSEFKVLVNGQNPVTYEIENSNTTRVLAIEFKQGSKLVEIYGNRITALE